MVTCKYCGVSHEVFRSTCFACGAPLQVEMKGVPEKTEAQMIVDEIRRICDTHMVRDFKDCRDFKDGESISDKRIDTLRKSFRIFPIGKEIFLYCDTTPLGTGKRGFLICEDGLYWQNSWTTPTNRNFITWDTFKNREILHKKFDLDLAKGDIIDMSGLGSNKLRELVAKLFKQIHDVLNEHSYERIE
jgi:hypothetical protein